VALWVLSSSWLLSAWASLWLATKNRVCFKYF
jgi:hypothetical protein